MSPPGPRPSDPAPAGIASSTSARTSLYLSLSVDPSVRLPVVTVNLPFTRSPPGAPSADADMSSDPTASSPHTRPSRHSILTNQSRTVSHERAQRRLAGLNTPPIAATSANRVPVISRRRLSSATGTTPGRHATYSKPFPIPSYLQHSNYSHQFFTTPTAESLFSKPTSATDTHESMDLSGGVDAASPSDDEFGIRKLSEGLGAGDIDPGKAASKPILLPTCWDDEDRCALIEVSSDSLGVSFAGSGKYGDRDAAAVRANRPIPHQAAVYYFEVSITDKGKQGYIGIGVSHQTVSLSRLPGWEANSWGYHGDDGFSFSSQGTGKVYGPTFGTGDVIGCGIDYTGVKIDKKKDKERPEDKTANGDGARCFFTKNGQFLGYAFSGLHGKLYPSVGLRTPGEIVRANFGSEPFVFDIDSLVRERKRAVQASVEATVVPPSLILPSAYPPIPRLLPPSPSEQLNETLQTLISSYLVHHGYSASAHAFATQLAEERVERAQGLVPSTSKTSVTDVTASSSFAVASGSDSIARAEIRRAFLDGEAEKAIELTQTHYPAVLLTDDESGGILFKLRMRAFVEAVLRAGLDEGTIVSETGESVLPPKTKRKRKAVLPEVGEEDVAMDDADERFSTPSTSPSFNVDLELPPETSPVSALDALLEMGQGLYAEYGSDPRPAVQEALELTFSLMAYTRPQERGGKIGRLLSLEARESLADELNSAILVSQSLPPMPQLESLLRHTSASIRLLGDIGQGGAALLPYPFFPSSPPPPLRHV